MKDATESGGDAALMGPLDFAGGTVVHVNAGVAALVAAWVLGPRRDYRSTGLLPHNIPFALLGAGGCGSAGSGSTPAAQSRPTASQFSPSRQRCWRRPRRWWWECCSTSRERANRRPWVPRTAIVLGLVAITPASGYVGPMSALILGGLAAIPSYFGLLWRASTSFDDSLDVVAAHGLGGTVGALLTGVFAQKALNGVADGALFGNPRQLLIQGAAVLSAIVYSRAMSFVLLKVVSLVVPLHAGRNDEGVEGWT